MGLEQSLARRFTGRCAAWPLNQGEKRMADKTVSKRAGASVKVAPDGLGHARRGTNGRYAPGDGATPGVLPAMRASVRRRDAARPSEAARPPRKSKRPKRAPGLGGRLAAAIRVARLRASRAAEEFGRRR